MGSDLPSFTAYSEGKLYLGFNDWGILGNQPAISDNAGSVTATITGGTVVGGGGPVVPEPISSTLFLIGGATLGFRRFRKSKVQ